MNASAGLFAADGHRRPQFADLAQSHGFHYVFGNSYVWLDHGDVRDGV